VFVCIPPGKAVPEMTYIVSGGTLNPTYSLTYFGPLASCCYLLHCFHVVQSDHSPEKSGKKINESINMALVFISRFLSNKFLLCYASMSFYSCYSASHNSLRDEY